MSADNRTRAGSVSSQCIQALRDGSKLGPSPLASMLDLKRLTPLVPQGFSSHEEALRERRWMRYYAEYCTKFMTSVKNENVVSVFG